MADTSGNNLLPHLPKNGGDAASTVGEKREDIGVGRRESCDDKEFG